MFSFRVKGILIIALGLVMFVACAPREEVKKQPAPATKKSELKVTKTTLTTSVKDRQPIDSALVFPDSIGRIYCWTLIEEIKEPMIIKHVWYYGKRKMAEIPLEVKPPRYRTWSYKTILPHWKGDWRVWIMDSQGNLLGTASFKIK